MPEVEEAKNIYLQITTGQWFSIWEICGGDLSSNGIELDIDVKTLPTVGPLFGSFDTHLDIFTAPIRLYSPKLHNNSLNVGLNMQNVQLPQMKKLINSSQVPSLLDV